MFWSIRKSITLRRISKKLAGPPDMGISYLQAIKGGGFDSISKMLDEEDVYIKKLYNLAQRDPQASEVLSSYAISEKEFEALYSSLVQCGAGVFRNGYWVAASSLVFCPTLEYVVKHKRMDGEFFSRATKRLILYFERNETGKLE